MRGREADLIALGDHVSLPVADAVLFWVQALGFRVQGSGFRVQGSGFRVQSSGQGSG